MNLMNRPFRLTSPYNIEPDIDAFASPYEAFQPDEPEEPAGSPYAASSRATMEATMGLGSGRRGYSTNANESALDSSPYEPGFVPATQVPGGSTSAGATFDPNPAGMAGGTSPDSKPGEGPSRYDAIGTEYGPEVSKDDVPRQGMKSDEEKYVSPEWAAVKRVDEEIAAEKGVSESWGARIGGLFSDRGAQAARSMKMRDLLAERSELVRQAMWADNRRSTEPAGKAFEAVGPDGQTHKYQLTKGGSRIDLGIAPKTREQERGEWEMKKAEMIRKREFIHDAEGNASVLNPYTMELEPVMINKKGLAQGPSDIGETPETPAPVGEITTSQEQFKVPLPKSELPPGEKVVDKVQNDKGDVTLIIQKPDGKRYTEFYPGKGKTSSKAELDEKLVTKAMESADRAVASARTANPMITADEENEVHSRAYERAMRQYRASFEAMGKGDKVPPPPPEGAGPAAPAAKETFTQADIDAKKLPKQGDTHYFRDSKTKNPVLFTWDEGKGWVKVGA